MGNLKKLLEKIMLTENIPLHRMRAYLEECGYYIHEINRRGDALCSGVPIKYSVEDFDKATALREKGFSLSQIAKEMKIPTGSVPYILKGFVIESEEK